MGGGMCTERPVYTRHVDKRALDALTFSSLAQYAPPSPHSSECVGETASPKCV